MKKTIGMMAQLLEKNNIPLPEGSRKKEGGSSLDNKKGAIVWFLDLQVRFRFFQAHGLHERFLLGPTFLKWSIHSHG